MITGVRDHSGFGEQDASYSGGIGVFEPSGCFGDEENEEERVKSVDEEGMTERKEASREGKWPAWIAITVRTREKERCVCRVSMLYDWKHIRTQ